jgi:hypothetical protein
MYLAELPKLDVLNITLLGLGRGWAEFLVSLTHVQCSRVTPIFIGMRIGMARCLL